MKKFAGDIIILHMCTKITIIWRMFPQIWSATDIIFGHYGPFFSLFALLGGYGPRKSKFWKKEKKILQDIIILQLFTINDSDMTYGFLDMECNRQIFLSFWTVFHSFTSTTQKITFWKTEKKPWRYHHFTKVYQNSWSYIILFLRYDA